MTFFQKNTKRTCLLSIFLFSLLFNISIGEVFAKKGVASDPESLYKVARQAFYSIKDSGNAARDREAWIRAGALFQKVYDSHPGSHRADDALFTLARIYNSLFKKYKNKKDLEQALLSFRKVTVEYPQSRLADDAQFNIAKIFLEIKKDKKKALEAFRKIIKLYPDGDKSKEASQEIALLGKDLPQPAENGNGLVELKAIRHWTNPSYTRIVLDMVSGLDFKEMRLRNPDRLYIDLYNAFLSKNLSNAVISVDDGLLEQVRASQHKPNVVRVVFDVKNYQDFKVFSYENPFRVVMDIRGGPSKKDEKPKTAQAVKKEPGKKEPPQEKDLSLAKIVIDAGHGGKDTGAVGLQGIEEKRIVLDVANRLKKILLKNLKCKVILTRDKDIFIPLEERTAIANTSNADIFISIHGNSAPRKAAYGIETFFLSNALSKRALETASRENMVTTQDMSDDLRFILSDMLANSNMRESSELAATIQKDMIRGLKKNYKNIKDLKAKGGPFYVLHGANMPSVLVEIGFLSNPMESKRIRQPKYRERTALALYHGIKRYLNGVRLSNY